jgi:hypothetical protein
MGMEKRQYYLKVPKGNFGRALCISILMSTTLSNYNVNQIELMIVIEQVFLHSAFYLLLPYFLFAESAPLLNRAI